jgi:hypothetical protein
MLTGQPEANGFFGSLAFLRLKKINAEISRKLHGNQANDRIVLDSPILWQQPSN